MLHSNIYDLLQVVGDRWEHLRLALISAMPASTPRVVLAMAAPNVQVGSMQVPRLHRHACVPVPDTPRQIISVKLLVLPVCIHLVSISSVQYLVLSHSIYADISGCQGCVGCPTGYYSGSAAASCSCAPPGYYTIDGISLVACPAGLYTSGCSNGCLQIIAGE